MLIGVYETLRSAGRPLELDLGERAPLADRLDELRDAARCLVDDAGATDLQRQNSARLLELLEGDPSPDRLLDLAAHKALGARAQTYEEARKAVEQAAPDEVALRDRDLLQELLDGFARATPRRSGARACSTSRTSSSSRATSSREHDGSASASTCASARSWSTSSRTRTGSSAS